MNKKNVIFITQTGVLLAILLVLQTVTKPMGQLFTGSMVNMVLIVSVLCFDIKSGIIVSILSPFFAFFLGIGPQFLPLTPAIAIGNLSYILVTYLLCKKINANNTNDVMHIYIKKIISIIIGSIIKFLVLYLLVVQFICKIFINTLKPQQITTFSAMFSIPQLITAIIGGFIACMISPILYKALNSNNQK